MADLAKQIFECLNPNMDLMEFSQIVVQKLLINHGFTQQLPDVNRQDTYKYTFYYRPEFLYVVKFEPIATNILFQMARVLNDDSQSISYIICEKPVFEGNSTINDRYIIEKLLVNLIKKFSKLWTNFCKVTETPTPEQCWTPEQC